MRLEAYIPILLNRNTMYSQCQGSHVSIKALMVLMLAYVKGLYKSAH